MPMLSECHPFIISEELTQALTSFNNHWQSRWQNRWFYAPIWEFGAQVTPEIRGAYEKFAPIHDFFHDLHRLARIFLIDSTWIPAALLVNDHCTKHCGMILPLSLPDFLNTIPEDFFPLLPLTTEKLKKLLCLLADPIFFGTEQQRYPLQQKQFKDLLAHLPQTPLHILDLGCGTGQGTYEIGHWLNSTQQNIHLIGLTLEKLEAWMATQRYLPHRQSSFSPLPKGNISCTFIAQDLFTKPWPQEDYDLIFCNGLFGGPVCNDFLQMSWLLEQVYQTLSPHGFLLMANHFHQGYLNHLAHFLQQSQNLQNWDIIMTPIQSLVLSPKKIRS